MTLADKPCAQLLNWLAVVSFLFCQAVATQAAAQTEREPLLPLCSDSGVTSGDLCRIISNGFDGPMETTCRGGFVDGGTCTVNPDASPPACDGVFLAGQEGNICEDADGDQCTFGSYNPSLGGCSSNTGISVGGCLAAVNLVINPADACRDDDILPPGGLDLVPQFRALQTEAVAAVIREHQLADTATNRARVFQYGQGRLNADMFARLLMMIRKPAGQLSDAEQQIMDLYAGAVKKLRVREAAAAEAEWQAIMANECGYEAPAGSDYEVPATCQTQFGGVFHLGLNHPSLDEIREFGVQTIRNAELVRDQDAAALSAETARGLAFGAALVGATLVATGVFFALLTTTAGSVFVAGVIGTIAPFAIAGPTIVGGFVLAPLIVAAAAIVTIVFLGIEFDEFADFQDAVERLEEDALAQPPPDLASLIQDDAGVAALFHVFVKSSEPRRRPSGAPPASGSEFAPQFKVLNEGGDVISESTPTITMFPDISTFAPPDPDIAAAPTSQEVGLVGGWFRPTLNINQANAETGVPDVITRESLALRIEYLNWAGDASVAWRRGTQFVLPQDDPNPDDDELPEPEVTDELDYLAADGSKRTARIVVDTTPPEVSVDGPAGDTNGSGWFSGPDTEVVFAVNEPDSTIQREVGCDTVNLSIDGVYEFSCTAESPGGVATAFATIMRDTSGPLFELPSPDRAPNENGWYNAPVTLSFDCVDPFPSGFFNVSDGGDQVSGVDNCLSDYVVDSPIGGLVFGPGAEFSGGIGETLLTGASVKDVAGNAVRGVFVPLSADRDLLGLSDDDILVSGFRDAVELTLRYDATAPDIAIDRPSDGAVYRQGEAVYVNWRVPNGANVDRFADGTRIPVADVSSSAPVGPGGLLDTSVLGAFDFTVTAEDEAGNAATLTHEYRVVAPMVNLDISDAVIAEPGGTASVTASLAEPVDLADVRVHLAFGGEATDNDFSASATTITIPAGETEAAITLTGTDDRLFEAGDESLLVRIAGAENARPGSSASARAAIEDDEQPPSARVVAFNTLFDESGGPATAEVRLSHPSVRETSVLLQYAGTADLGTDFTGPASVVVPALDLGVPISITPLDDELQEGREIVRVIPRPQLGGRTGGAATLVLRDDAGDGGTGSDGGDDPDQEDTGDDEPGPDTSRTLNLFTDTETLAEDGGQTEVTAMLDGPADVDVTFGLTFGGDATRGQDYRTAAAALTIPAGEASASMTLTGVDDAIDEPDERIAVTLSSAVGAEIGSAGNVSVSIVDDDGPPSVTLIADDAAVIETGGSTAISARLSAPASRPVTVNLVTGGAAARGGDYSLAAGSLTIAPGATSASTVLTAISDGQHEPDELAIVAVDSVSGAETGMPASSTVALTDDDDPPAGESRRDRAGPVANTRFEPGQRQIPATAFGLTNPGATQALVHSISVDAGTGSLAIAGARLYLDRDQDGRISDGEPLLELADPAGPQSRLRFTLAAPLIIDGGQTLHFVVTIDAAELE